MIGSALYQYLLGRPTTVGRSYILLLSFIFNNQTFNLTAGAAAPQQKYRVAQKIGTILVRLNFTKY